MGVRDVFEIGAAIGVPFAAGPIFGMRGARDQSEAAQQISAAQIAANIAAQNRAASALDTATKRALSNIHVGAEQARGFTDAEMQARLGAFTLGQGRARQDLLNARKGSLGELTQAESAARIPLQQLADLGLGAIPGATTAIGVRDLLGSPAAQGGQFNLLNAPGSAGGQIDVRGGPAGGFSTSNLLAGPAAGLGQVNLLADPSSGASASNLLAGPGATLGSSNLLGGPAAQRSQALQGDIFSGFQQDPGFQFALEQGEQAIERAAAARGGRGGGRFAKELGRFTEGLANQRFGEFAQRRLAETGLRTQAEQQDLSRMANLAATQAGLEQQGLGRLAGLSQAQAGLEQQDLARRAGLLTTQAGVEQQGLGRIAGLSTAQAGLEQQDLARLAGLATTQAGLEQQDLARLAGLSTTQAGLEQQDLARLAGLTTTQAGLEQQAGLAAQQNLAGIAQTGLGGLSDLAELSSQFGALRADTLSGFGRNLSDLSSATGMGRSDILGSRFATLRDITQQEAADRARIGIGQSGQLASVLTGQPLQNITEALGLPAQVAGGQNFAIQSGIQDLQQIAAGLGGRAIGSGAFSFGRPQAPPQQFRV